MKYNVIFLIIIIILLLCISITTNYITTNYITTNYITTNYITTNYITNIPLYITGLFLSSILVILFYDNTLNYNNGILGGDDISNDISNDISLTEYCKNFNWRKINIKNVNSLEKSNNMFIDYDKKNRAKIIRLGRVYSQNDEDGIINTIFNIIGTTNKEYVEFGVEDGSECNSRYLREKKGWTGLMFDGGNENKEIGFYKEFINRENILSIFKKYKVNNQMDLLSIDIDGMDYYIWEEISTYYKPRLLVIEYNCYYNNDTVMDYKSDYMWDKKNTYQGASLKALIRLCKSKGYILVQTNGINAFFIKNNIYKKYKKYFPHDGNFNKLMEKHPIVLKLNNKKNIYRY